MDTDRMSGNPKEADEYEDWLEEIRGIGGELAWIRRNNLVALHSLGRTTAQIGTAVMGSKRMRDTIGQLSAQRGVAEAVVRAEAQQILATMAHDMHFHSAVQPIGYSLAKIFRRLFSHIWVNSGQMQRVRALQAEDPSVPIVWLPTHRSYLDFLLLSMLSYHYHIPLPAICAADDFRASYLLGEALRRCGAFFIRRTFREDPLYWAVFAEYVQQHLLHADCPIEFFVEGQRSRTGKSLSPRTGLLQLALEPFLRAKLFDTILVPISIDYDRILEELLHAQELIGFSKPKETTSGLLRARTVLNDSFGEIRITVGEPISLRQYFLGNGREDIRMEMVGKGAEDDEMGAKVRQRVRELALDIVRRHNTQSPPTMGPFIALALLQSLNALSSPSSPSVSISFTALRHQLTSLLELYRKCTDGRRPIWRRPNGAPEMDQQIRDFVRLHHSHLSFAPGNDHSVLITDISPPDNQFPPFLLNCVLLANQSNRIIHTLAPFCLIAILRISKGLYGDHQNDSDQDEMFADYCFLRRLFAYDFVHNSDDESAEFRHISRRLSTISSLSDLATLLMPFLLAYHSVLCVLLDSSSSALPISELSLQTHHGLLDLIRRHPGGIPLQIASSDLVKNVLNSLRECEMAKLDGEKRIHLNFAELSKLEKRLGKVMAGVTGETPMGPTIRPKAKI